MKRERERWNRKKMIKRLKMIPDLSFLSLSLVDLLLCKWCVSLSLSFADKKKDKKEKSIRDERWWMSRYIFSFLDHHFHPLLFPFLIFQLWLNFLSLPQFLSLSLVTSSLVDRKWSLEMWFKDRTNVIRPRGRERVSKCPSGRDRIQGMSKEESHKEAGKKS